MLKKRTPDSNIPQVLDSSAEKDFLKVTLILPVRRGKQKGIYNRYRRRTQSFIA